MKLLTVNLAMEAGKSPARLEALGRLVRARRPEFLALQGLNNDTIKSILSTTWGSRYHVSQPPTRFETRTKPTVAIFSTYPAQDVKTIPFRRSASNCLLLLAYYLMYDKQKSPHVISVCAMSLEGGLQHTELREVQLNEALMGCTEDQDSFVMGDLGVINEIDGGIHLNSPWKDAWLGGEAHTEKNGDTYIPGTNPLITSKERFNGRPDRFLYKTRRYQLDSVEVMGPSDGGDKISPHFGLFAVFSPLDAVGPPHEEEEVACFFERPQWSLSFEQHKEQ